MCVQVLFICILLVCVSFAKKKKVAKKDIFFKSTQSPIENHRKYYGIGD